MTANSGGGAIEDVLASERQEAEVLRARGLTDRANDIVKVCDRIQAALPDYFRWLNPTDASLWSGLSDVALRRRFEGMRAANQAKRVGRVRYYRASALPRTADVSALRRRARSAARQTA